MYGINMFDLYNELHLSSYVHDNGFIELIFEDNKDFHINICQINQKDILISLSNKTVTMTKVVTIYELCSFINQFCGIVDIRDGIVFDELFWMIQKDYSDCVYANDNINIDHDDSFCKPNNYVDLVKTVKISAEYFSNNDLFKLLIKISNRKSEYLKIRRSDLQSVLIVFINYLSN